MAAVFNYCLKGNVTEPLTWKSIVDILKSDDIEEGGLANQIDKKHCQKDVEQHNITKQEEPIEVAESLKQESLQQESMKQELSPKHKGKVLMIILAHT